MTFRHSQKPFLSKNRRTVLFLFHIIQQCEWSINKWYEADIPRTFFQWCENGFMKCFLRNSNFAYWNENAYKVMQRTIANDHWKIRGIRVLDFILRRLFSCNHFKLLVFFRNRQLLEAPLFFEDEELFESCISLESLTTSFSRSWIRFSFDSYKSCISSSLSFHFCLLFREYSAFLFRRKSFFSESGIFVHWTCLLELDDILAGTSSPSSSSGWQIYRWIDDSGNMTCLH